MKLYMLTSEEGRDAALKGSLPPINSKNPFTLKNWVGGFHTLERNTSYAAENGTVHKMIGIGPKPINDIYAKLMIGCHLRYIM